MPEWIRPEFHELDEAEIAELAQTKNIHKQPKQESPLSIVLGFVLMMLGLIALGIMLLAY